MYQQIHELVSVAGVYRQLGDVHGKFCLKKFQWRDRVYPIDRVTLMVNVKDGGVKQRIYSVQSGANIYRILFNRENELWYLEELWLE